MEPCPILAEWLLTYLCKLYIVFSSLYLLDISESIVSSTVPSVWIYDIECILNPIRIIWSELKP